MLLDTQCGWLVRAVPVAGVVTAFAGPAPAAAAAAAVDVVPTLTSTPFGATPGRSVKHTITVSATGTGPATAVRVTFTTTVGLDDVAATASVGNCPTVTAQKVVCELGNLDFANAGAAVPEVTITGTVDSDTAPGALVQNLVDVTSQHADADPDNNVVSNAYLMPGGSAPADASSSGPNAQSQSSATAAQTSLNRLPLFVAILALGALVAASLIFVRRRNRRP